MDWRNGNIVFYIAILPLLGVGGVQLFKAEAPGPVSDKIKPRVRETAKILWTIYVGITALQIICLKIQEWKHLILYASFYYNAQEDSQQNARAYFDNPMIHYIIFFYVCSRSQFFTPF